MPTAPLGDKAGPIRVLLVDDHELVRQAISLAFDGSPDIELVAQAALAGDGLVAARQHRPDVVLLDRRLPDGDAVEVIGQFLQASPASRVLVFTGYADDEIAARVIDVGAAGLVLKARQVDGLVAAIRRVAAGERVLPPESPGELPVILQPLARTSARETAQVNTVRS